MFPNTHSSAYFTHKISEMTYKTSHPGVLRTHTFFTLCVKKKQRTYIILEPRVPDKLFSQNYHPRKIGDWFSTWLPRFPRCFCVFKHSSWSVCFRFCLSDFRKTSARRANPRLCYKLVTSDLLRQPIAAAETQVFTSAAARESSDRWCFAALVAIKNFNQEK